MNLCRDEPVVTLRRGCAALCLLAIAGLLGCDDEAGAGSASSSQRQSAETKASRGTERRPEADRETDPEAPSPDRPTRGDDCRAVARYASGAVVGNVCLDEAAEAGLTPIDLSDNWAPLILRGDGEGPEPAYRATFIALANERPPPDRRTPAEKYLELFGIFPTLAVLRSRSPDGSGETAADACRAPLTGDALAALLGRPLRVSEAMIEVDRRRRTELDRVERSLARLHAIVGGANPAEAAAAAATAARPRPEPSRAVARLEQRRSYLRGVLDPMAALQRRLVCHGVLDGDRAELGIYDFPTHQALRDFQQRHMIIPEPTLEAWALARLGDSPAELRFRTALRVLRERVVDATGLIEDGTARNRPAAVIDRQLDPPELGGVAGYPPLANGAGDLVSAATDAAARALGWTSPEAFAAWLMDLDPPATASLWVAAALPRPPADHGPHMVLSASLDRGDIDYGLPGSRTHPEGWRRPSLSLVHGSGQTATVLMRWSTTIGGWKAETAADGREGLRYKVSPAGARVWRDVIASPAWLPPPTAPDSGLIRRFRGDAWQPNYALIGPGHRSAYGLAMMVHHNPIVPWVPPAERAQRRATADDTDQQGDDGEELFFQDEGIRSHGSVSYASILHGESHGCHRLFNHLAIRLAGFLLRHRHHARRGEAPVGYSRVLRLNGRAQAIHIDSRGYHYELTPPVVVEVLEGTIHGPRREPPLGLLVTRRGAAADD